MSRVGTIHWHEIKRLVLSKRQPGSLQIVLHRGPVRSEDMQILVWLGCAPLGRRLQFALKVLGRIQLCLLSTCPRRESRGRLEVLLTYDRPLTASWDEDAEALCSAAGLNSLEGRSRGARRRIGEENFSAV